MNAFIQRREVIFFAAIAIIVLGGAYWISKNKAVAPVTSNVAEQQNQADGRVVLDSGLTLDVRNATYNIDGTSIVLNDGISNSNIPGSSASRKTIVLEGPAFADVNGDGAKDAIVILRDETGGSGIFYYVSSVIASGASQKATNSIILGDRIRIKAISIDNGIASITILDREPTDAMAAVPSVPKTLKFKLSGESLVSVQ